MVVMGFSFAVWVEGLDFGLRFPAKSSLEGKNNRGDNGIPRQNQLRLLKKSLRECKKHQQKSFHHFSLAIFPQKREPLGPFFLYFSDYFSHICDKYGRCTLYSHTK